MDAALPGRPVTGKPRGQHLRVIIALVLREMGTRHGRSDGGYFWAFGEPLGRILLLSIFFSMALRAPPLGTSFVLFYATGNIPYSMFKTMQQRISGSVNSNRGLLNYPVVTLLDAVLAKFLLQLVTLLVVAVVLFTGIILFFGLYVNLDLAAVTRALTMAATLGLGIGTMNCLLFGLYPTWKNIWNIITRPLYLLSGVLFTYENVPSAKLQAIMWWNPVIHVTAEMRAGFYGTYDPQFVSYPYVFGIALGTFALGAYLMRRHATTLIEG